jgi:hypothetical protein
MIDKQQLDADLTAILPYLPGWQLDTAYARHTWCAVLRDGTGKGIHVNATQAKGRLHISGMWPSDSTHQQCTPDKPLHISVARNRPPEKIAADLQRRFLPWYTAAYAEQAEQAARQNDSRTRQQEVTVELAALLGDDAARRSQSDPNQVYAPGVTVDVHSGGETASVQLRYKSIKVVKAVLRALVKAGGLTE